MSTPVSQGTFHVRSIRAPNTMVHVMLWSLELGALPLFQGINGNNFMMHYCICNPACVTLRSLLEPKNLHNICARIVIWWYWQNKIARPHLCYSLLMDSHLKSLTIQKSKVTGSRHIWKEIQISTFSIGNEESPLSSKKNYSNHDSWHMLAMPEALPNIQRLT